MKRHIHSLWLHQWRAYDICLRLKGPLILVEDEQEVNQQNPKNDEKMKPKGSRPWVVGPSSMIEIGPWPALAVGTRELPYPLEERKTKRDDFCCYCALSKSDARHLFPVSSSKSGVSYVLHPCCRHPANQDVAQRLRSARVPLSRNLGDKVSHGTLLP